jgi:hypothetical protein
MPVVPSRLSLEVKLQLVIPEVIAILDQMVEVYNDWEAPTYLKFESYVSDPQKSSAPSSRYQLFETKEALLEAIEQNCPAGCSIIHN